MYGYVEELAEKNLRLLLRAERLAKSSRTGTPSRKKPGNKTKCEQRYQNSAIGEGPTQICFDQPDEVNHACSSTEINETVQHAPALTAEPPDPACRRGKSQRQHQRPRRHAGGDEAALGNIVQHLMDIKKLIQPHICQQMERAIKECIEAQHAPKANQPG